MLKEIVNGLLGRVGLQVVRQPSRRLPILHESSLDGVRFPFWIVNEHAARWWMDHPVRFDAEMQFLQTAARPGARVIEVGAHHGMYTVQLARWVGAEGRVFALEVNPANALALSANVGVNRLSQVSVLCAAAGDRDGTTTVSGERVSKTGVEVPMIQVDTLCALHGVDSIDLLKIDVEGFEAHVLRGAVNALGRTANLSLELHLDDLDKYGSSLDEVWRMIATGEREIVLMQRPEWFRTRRLAAKEELPSSGVVNLFIRSRAQ